MQNKEYFGNIFKQINTKYECCLWPIEKCLEKSCRAHSIQNSKILDLLCVDDHVYILKPILNINTGPNVIWDRIGRNKATTFTGLCNHHDTILFEDVEKNEFEPTNSKHLFLYAYRSILKENHAIMKKAIDIESMYLNGAHKGLFDSDMSNEAMMLATYNLFAAYMFDKYKSVFDNIYISERFELIDHKIITIQNIKPSIAVSSVIRCIENYNSISLKDEPKYTLINVFPYDIGVIILFSFLKEHENDVVRYLDRILTTQNNYQLYLISKLILIHCENFVVSPKFYETLSEDRKNKISNFYMENWTYKKIDREDEELFLFY